MEAEDIAGRCGGSKAAGGVAFARVRAGGGGVGEIDAIPGGTNCTSSSEKIERGLSGATEFGGTNGAAGERTMGAAGAGPAVGAAGPDAAAAAAKSGEEGLGRNGCEDCGGWKAGGVDAGCWANDCVQLGRLVSPVAVGDCADVCCAPSSTKVTVMPGASRNWSPVCSECSWMRTPLCWRPLVLCISAICHWPLTRRISACCREIWAEGRTMSL